MKHSKVAIIKEFTEINLDDKETYSFVSFKKTIILFQQSSNLNLEKLIQKYQNLTIFYLPNEQEENQHIFLEEINSLSYYLIFKKETYRFFKEIRKCIAGYFRYLKKKKKN